MESRLCTRPKFNKITEDIYKLVVRLPEGMGMGEVNSYLIRGKQGFTVIDTGSNSQESIDIWNFVIESGFVVEKVVLTHIHPDHIGLAEWFQKNCRAKVFLSSLGYKEIRSNRKHLKVRKAEVETFFKKHGGPKLTIDIESIKPTVNSFEPDELFENDDFIEIGDSFYKAIWTPGHATDHFCFYNQSDKVMIAGDLVLDSVFPVVITTDDSINSLGDYFDSLEVIKSLPSNLTLPGHGEIIENLEKRVNVTMDGHNRRLQQILTCMNGERKTAGQVCNEIYNHKQFDKTLEIGSFIATVTRMIYLESIKKLRRSYEDGQVFYHII